MKLFDKLNGGSEDEEVELRPDSKKREASAVNAGPASSEDGDTTGSTGDETALLPGAVGGGETSSSSTSSSSVTNDGDLEEQIQRVIEQNERIIELLETISSVSSGSKGRSKTADTGNDELW